MPITIDVSDSVWYEEALRKGISQGKAEGRAEGRAEGWAEGLLQRLLEKRFGPLPDAVIQRLHAASLAETETWIMNLLEAKTLDEVFRR